MTKNPQSPPPLPLADMAFDLADLFHAAEWSSACAFSTVLESTTWSSDVLSRALHVAARAGNAATFRALQACGADSGASFRGATLIQSASASGSPEVLRMACLAQHAACGCLSPLQLAIAMGEADVGSVASLETAPPTSVITPLQLASALGVPGVLPSLVAGGGATLDDVTVDGKSALWFAASFGQHACVRELLRLGAKPTLCDASRATPLHAACERGHTSCVSLLASFRPSQANAAGVAPLHVAACGGHAAACALLLLAGADVDGAGFRSLTPLHGAAVSGSVAVVMLLLLAGADPRAVSYDRLTALHMAVSAAARSHILSDVGRALAGAAPTSLDVVSVLLAAGAHANAVDVHQCTALHHLCGSPVFSPDDAVHAARLLLRHGADPLLVDRNGRTALHMAAAGGCVAVVLELLRVCPSAVQCRCAGGLSPLHLAVAHPDVVAALLRAGASSTATDDDGATPLYALASMSSCAPAATARMLLGAGCLVDATTSDGVRPITRAAYRGHVALLDVFADAGALRDCLPGESRTPVHAAVECGDERCLRLLLDRGFVVNALSHTRRSPLFQAVYELRSPARTCATLLDAGADPLQTCQPYGASPLVMAAFCAHADCFELMLRARPDAACGVNAVMDGGQRPLGLAVARGHTHAVRMLLGVAGVDVDQRGVDGETALHWAALEDDDVNAEQLIAAGAAVNAQDATGESPLHWAARSSSVSVVRLLLQAGGDLCLVDAHGVPPAAAVDLPAWVPVWPPRDAAACDNHDDHDEDDTTGDAVLQAVAVMCELRIAWAWQRRRGAVVGCAVR